MTRAACIATAPEGPFDLVIYVGLAEYLDDAEVVRHLVALRGRLADDGALLTSTTAPHDSQKRMNERLGWQTRPTDHVRRPRFLCAHGGEPHAWQGGGSSCRPGCGGCCRG